MSININVDDKINFLKETDVPLNQQLKKTAWAIAFSQPEIGWFWYLYSFKLSTVILFYIV